MTDNQSVELDEILTNLVSDWQDWLHNGKPGEGAELIKQSKAQLNQLLIKERIDELDKLSKMKWFDLAYDIPGYLVERTTHLQSQLNKEQL